ncbi:hypothetical protein J2780_001579 [Chryseobacterium camelliae]|nr:hypothetical protein [Chryseobacterium camelliae]
MTNLMASWFIWMSDKRETVNREFAPAVNVSPQVNFYSNQKLTIDPKDLTITLFLSKPSAYFVIWSFFDKFNPT